MTLADSQRKDLSEKVVFGLERISEAFKSLIWGKAKTYGLSPIQIQILIFVANHKEELSSVSNLAKEFHVTKPTISDAVKALDQKGYIVKNYSSADSRSYTIFLSDLGKEMLAKTSDYTLPFFKGFEKMEDREIIQLYSTLTKLVFELNRSGILTIQRTCLACKFHELNNNKHHCHLMGKDLAETELMLDCADYEVKP